MSLLKSLGIISSGEVYRVVYFISNEEVLFLKKQNSTCFKDKHKFRSYFYGLVRTLSSDKSHFQAS